MHLYKGTPRAAVWYEERYRCAVCRVGVTHQYKNSYDTGKSANIHEGDDEAVSP